MINKRFSLTFITIFLCLNQRIKAELDRAKFIPINPPKIIFDHDADLAEKEKARKEQELQERNQKIAISEPSPEEKILFEESFTQAPSSIKALVTGMLKKEAWALRYKNILLTGPSGSGKTTLAQAIAYKLNRKHLLIHAPTLLGHYRDQAVENIRALFQQLNEYKEMPVLIMDEMNALTDDHISEHSDTKHTAMQFWTLLDKYKNDKDFLFIGTTNITKKMPHQLQSRFKGRTFLIDHPSLEARKRSIKFCIQKLGATTDATCNDQYLEELAYKTENFSQRDIETLIDTAFLLFRMKNPNQIAKIAKEHLEHACIKLNQENEKLWDFTEQMTTEDRRHRETSAQNKKQFEENQALQIKLAEWNMLFQSLIKQYEKAPLQAWFKYVEALNLAKGIVFPDQKPLSKISEIPGWRLLGLAPDYKLKPNEESEKKR